MAIDPETKRPIRNRVDIQHESLRTRIVRGDLMFDEVFEEIHDGLSEAYYGARLDNGAHDRATGWSAGVSKPFSDPFIAAGRIFDVQANPRKSKELFDRLHGMIFHIRAVSMHRLNMSLSLAEQLPREEYDVLKRDDEGVPTVFKSDASQVRLDTEKNDPSDPIDFRDPV